MKVTLGTRSLQMSKNMNKRRVFAYFLCTVELSTSKKIAYMYTFKIMFDTSIIQCTRDASEMYISV
jgi:hypothetical protein